MQKKTHQTALEDWTEDSNDNFSHQNLASHHSGDRILWIQVDLRNWEECLLNFPFGYPSFILVSRLSCKQRQVNVFFLETGKKRKEDCLEHQYNIKKMQNVKLFLFKLLFFSTQNVVRYWK